MNSVDELSAVKEIIGILPKTRRIMRLYQSNNPIYSIIVNECFRRFTEYFKFNDTFNIKFRQSDILYDSESVYSNADQFENLAFIFFKDGIKEISIGNEISIQEMEDFLKIISVQDNEESENDIAILLWEKDFANIRYVVDETFLDDKDDYETEAMSELQRESTPPESLQEAFEDLLHDKHGIEETPVVILTEDDFQLLVKEIEDDSHDKTPKLLNILFGMFYETETKADCHEIALFIMNALKHCVEQENMRNVIDVQIRLQLLVMEINLSGMIKNQARKISAYISSKNIISLTGRYYDKNHDADKNVFNEFVKLLDEKAILPMISTLGEMETIQGRKLFIEALIGLGRKDINSLVRGLNDSRWYVVRNVVYILGKIGDRGVTDHVRIAVKHEDNRVKKEAIKTLGVIGGDNVLGTLCECFATPEVKVRNSAARALGKIGTEKAKKAVMTEILKKHFSKREFNEKKVFFEVLSNWKDNDVYDFMIKMVKKRSWLRGVKQNEIRACAAYGLGLLGNKSAVSILNKFRNSGNKLLREYSCSALQRLGNE